MRSGVAKAAVKSAKRKTANARAQPIFYSEKLGAMICDRIAAGEALIHICAEEGMPSAYTVRRWAADPEHPMCAKYARARDAQADTLAEEILAIADADPKVVEVLDADGNVVDLKADSAFEQWRRTRIDTRKWAASKLMPKRYGDRVQNEHTGPDGKPLQLSAPPVLILAPAAPGDAPITLAPLEQPARRIEGDAKQ